MSIHAVPAALAPRLSGCHGCLLYSGVKSGQTKRVCPSGIPPPDGKVAETRHLVLIGKAVSNQIGIW